MLYLVLKELPQGQQPGETIDVPEAIGAVLLRVGAVKVVEVEEVPVRRRTYRRADLQADAVD
jgi:hypothetical protein